MTLFGLTNPTNNSQNMELFDNRLPQFLYTSWMAFGYLIQIFLDVLDFLCTINL